MISEIYYMLKSQMLLLLMSMEPDKHQWVFSSTDNCCFNYNSKYLFLYVKENMPDIQPYYVINNDELRNKLNKKYGEGYFVETKTLGGMKKVLKCGVWFTSAGFPVYGFNIAKKHTIINLWHGVPLKKIALLEEKVSVSKLYFHLVFSNNYGYILTTSEELRGIMADSFGVDKNKIKIWGQPRNDCLYQNVNRNLCLEKIYGELPEYRKVILYAPTYREYGKTKIFPFLDFDVKKLEEYLENNKLLICMRMHIEEENLELLSNKRILNMNADMVDDVMEILNIFDLLITDYSSIYIDYLLLNRPIIFLPYDKEEYLEKRGMNFNYDEVTPGEKPKSMKEFLSAIDHAWEDDRYLKKRFEINNKFNQIKGPCSNNICHEVCEMEDI